ncbi:hypothetical protein ACFL6C_11835 [Myxococcota bacterium]
MRAVGAGIVDFDSYRRDRLLPKLEELRTEVARHAGIAEVFASDWFNDLEKLIRDHSGTEKEFQVGRTFPLYQTFLMDESEDWADNVVARLDDAYTALRDATPKRSPLRKKLRDSALGLDAWYGAVFETVVLSRLAKAGCLVEYEPRVGRGGKSIDGLVEIDGVQIFVEATARLRPEPAGMGSFDPAAEAADAFNKRVVEKAKDQLALCEAPCILFLGWRAYDDELPVFERLLETCSECTSVSVLAVAPPWCEHGSLFLNSKARYPATEGVLVEFQRCMGW